MLGKTCQIANGMRNLGHKAPSETTEDARRGEAERRKRDPESWEIQEHGGQERRNTQGRQSQPALLQAEQRRQDRAARGGKDSARADGGAKLPHTHLPTTCPRGQRPGWPKEVRVTSVAVPGRGSQSDGAKMKAAVSRSRLAAPAPGACPQVWEARLRNNRR